MQSLEKGLQKQIADTSRRNASWGQKELALSADHVSLIRPCIPQQATCLSPVVFHGAPAVWC